MTYCVIYQATASVLLTGVSPYVNVGSRATPMHQRGTAEYEALLILGPASSQIRTHAKPAPLFVFMLIYFIGAHVGRCSDLVLALNKVIKRRQEMDEIRKRSWDSRERRRGIKLRDWGTVANVCDFFHSQSTTLGGREVSCTGSSCKAQQKCRAREVYRERSWVEACPSGAPGGRRGKMAQAPCGERGAKSLLPPWCAPPSPLYPRGHPPFPPCPV